MSVSTNHAATVAVPTRQAASGVTALPALLSVLTAPPAWVSYLH